MQFLQTHDFPDNSVDTRRNNSALISLLTHQQGALPSTAHKLFF